MRNLLLFFIFILAATGFVADGAKIPDDNVLVGTKTAVEKGFEFNFGGSNTKLKILNDSDKTLNYDHNAFAIGDGSSANAKKLIFNGFSGAALEVDNYILDWNQNQFNVGDGTASDKKIYWNYGSLDKYIGYNSSTGKAVFNNGTGEEVMGSGSGGGGASGGINFLANPSFEDVGSPIASWSNTGGSLSQETHAYGRTGNLRYALFTASGSGEYIESSLATVSSDVNGGCMADFKYNQGDTAFDYQVLNASSDVVSTGSVGDLTEFLKAPTVTFPCAAGEQFKLKIISTGAGTIEVDEAYLGSNKGFIDFDGKTIFSAQVNGTVSPSTVSNEAPSDWISGGCARNSTGNYTCSTAPGLFTSPLNCGCSFSGTGAVTCAAGNYALDGSSFDVYMYNTVPSAYNGLFNIYCQAGALDAAKSLPAWSPEQADFFISANIGGAIMSTSVTSSPLTLSSGALTMEVNSGSAKITCSSTNPATGTTCATGNEVVGLVVNIPMAGKYKYCFAFPFGGGVNSFRLAETGLSNETIIQQGKGYAGNPLTDGQYSVRLCDYLTFDSVGEKAVRLFYESASSGALYADRSASGYERDINITVELVGHNVSRPIIQNMVDTTIKKGIRIESCNVSNLAAPSSDCASWIDSGSFYNSYNIQLDIRAGVFSKVLSCVAGSYQGVADQTGGYPIYAANRYFDTTKFQYALYNGSTIFQGPSQVICIGER